MTIIQNRLVRKNSLIASKNYIAVALLQFCGAFQTTAILRTGCGIDSNQKITLKQFAGYIENGWPVAILHKTLQGRLYVPG